MDKIEWQGDTGHKWASEWRRTDRSFGALTERLLNESRVFQFSSVLDVGCGAGELSLAIARGRTQVEVIGLDISPELVAVARQRGENLANVDFAQGDASQWTPSAGFRPQLLVSRHGLMFFADPPRAFFHLAHVADSDAGLLFSCFRAASENPFFTEVARLLPEPPAPPEPGAPGPFAFGDRAHVAGILAEGGWKNVALVPFDFAMVVGAGEDPVEDALHYLTTIGPAARAAADMPDDARQRLFDRVREVTRRRCHDGVVSFPAAAWIATARKA